MPSDINFISIIEARYKTINYPEIIFIKKVDSVTVKKFIKNYILYRYNISIKLKVNKSLKNKKEIIKICFTLNITCLIKPAYIPYR